MKKRDKKFLNDSTSEFGSVAWSVSTEDGYDMYVLEGSLQIQDCGSRISLDFDCEKPKHIQKRIDKLDSLIHSLQEMKVALEEGQSEVLGRKPKFYY